MVSSYLTRIILAGKDLVKIDIGFTNCEGYPSGRYVNYRTGGSLSTGTTRGYIRMGIYIMCGQQGVWLVSGLSFMGVTKGGVM